MLLVVVLVAGLIFVVGLLLGQEWNRRELSARQRRVVALRRECDDLVEQLTRLDEHHRPWRR